MQLVIVAAITVCAASRARAHVAPSVDDNNRYLKVTPASDRVRLAYTVFFGEVPGAQMRGTLDANRDGQISDAEGQAFGTKLALEVAAGIELTVDGTTRPISWATVAVGMGTPAVRAGSFSVDMIAWVCLPAASTHAILLRDRFRVPKPGETEVRVEDGLGITIQHARVGAADDPSRDYKFIGPGGPLMDDGLDLAFTVTDKAPRGDATCAAAPTGSPGTSLATVLAIVAAALALGVAVVIVARRSVRSRAV